MKSMRCPYCGTNAPPILRINVAVELMKYRMSCMICGHKGRRAMTEFGAKWKWRKEWAKRGK